MAMQINLAKYAGFCVGVKRAIEIALKTASLENKVYMLGDIVHNEDVVRQIKAAGIKKIQRLNCGINKALLIPAHGASAAIYVKARKSGYKIIDATCPMVKEIHRIAKNAEEDGYRVIVIGDKNHAEVKGIAGQLKHPALIIDEIKNIPRAKIKTLKKTAIVVQSTQDLDKVTKIVNILNRYSKHLRFYNTVCNPTRLRQEEVKGMPKKNDLMLIIGSKNSANTKRLYEISRSLNTRSFWVTGKKDLKKEWFKGISSVGIAAGASTPDSTTEDIVNFIKKSFNLPD